MGFINQFPYSDFHELNIDWLIKETKSIKTQIETLQEEFEKIKVLTEEQINEMINAAIASNNVILYNRMEALKEELTLAYKAYTDNQISQLKIYTDNQDVYYNNLAQGYADTALIDSKAYTDNKILDYTMMINPLDGQYEDVREVVDDIINKFHSDGSLTALEYDTLDLTASGYDAYDLTAFDYDFNGKNLLI